MNSLSVTGEAFPFLLPSYTYWQVFRKYSETEHKPQPYLSENPPMAQLMICIPHWSPQITMFELLTCWTVSCIDIRVSVERLLGIKTEGEERKELYLVLIKLTNFNIEAFIVRNGGGRVRSSLTDLLFLDTFTQGQMLKDIIVIHHTGNEAPLCIPILLTFQTVASRTTPTRESRMDWKPRLHTLLMRLTSWISAVSVPPKSKFNARSLAEVVEHFDHDANPLTRMHVGLRRVSERIWDSWRPSLLLEKNLQTMQRATFGTSRRENWLPFVTKCEVQSFPCRRIARHVINVTLQRWQFRQAWKGDLLDSQYNHLLTTLFVLFPDYIVIFCVFSFARRVKRVA